MREVMISIQPKWVEKIVSGEKTVEVRKTKPKLNTPFKCYIYETKGKLKWCNKCQDTDCERPYPNCACHEGWGKVIGEFVCDSIETIEYQPSYYICRLGTQLSNSEMWEYGRGKPLYGWHISDLVIYDKPKELSEFEKPCEEFEISSVYSPTIMKVRGRPKFIERPPQSWCYIEPRQTAD